MDQAVSMLPDAQHSARLTSVFSTRLQVASRPCWSQQTPPADKGAVPTRPKVPSSVPPNTQASTFHPAPGHGDTYSWYSVTGVAGDLPPICEGGAENCPGVPTLAPDCFEILSLYAPAPTLLHCQPPPISGSSPPSIQAPGPGLASCPTSQTPRAGHVRVSGPWSCLSRLCPLSRQRPRARGAPSPGSPPSPGPPLTHSPCMSSLSPRGRGLRGGGLALPSLQDWGGAAGWDGGQMPSVYAPLSGGRSGHQPPFRRAPRLPGTVLSTSRDQLWMPSTLAPPCKRGN